MGVDVGVDKGMGGGAELDLERALDTMDPADTEIVPDPGLVKLYAEIRSFSDRVASAVLGLSDPGLSGPRR